MKALLLILLEAVIRAVLPAVLDRLKPKAADAAGDIDLRDRLTGRIRRTWGAAPVLLAVALLVLPGCGAGIGTRTIYVASGEPVRLRETIRGAAVWVLGPDGRPVAGRMDLPEGWYCLPDPGPAPAEPARPDPPAGPVPYLPPNATAAGGP